MNRSSKPLFQSTKINFKYVQFQKVIYEILVDLHISLNDYLQ